mmetsp:Transcript_23219/g.31010  ORF Transcript_23219/g.31010 Transcript_23219/m.31010 type:complete len:104 (+) Transcript_23219:1110-1421(+)
MSLRKGEEDDLQAAKVQDEEMKEGSGEGKPDMTQYACMDDFRADIKQIFDNARTYNSKETIFFKYAQQLEALIKPMLNRLRDTQINHGPEADVEISKGSIANK